MKKLLIGLLVLGSLSAFAEECVSLVHFNLCADLVKQENSTLLENITMDTYFGRSTIRPKNFDGNEVCKKFGLTRMITKSTARNYTLVTNGYAEFKKRRVIVQIECI